MFILKKFNDSERVLTTGDRIVVSHKSMKPVEYEFIGFSLDDAQSNGTGCSYLVLRNVSTNDTFGVERTWFDEFQTKRNIQIIQNRTQQNY